MSSAGQRAIGRWAVECKILLAGMVLFLAGGIGVEVGAGTLTRRIRSTRSGRIRSKCRLFLKSNDKPLRRL